MKSTLLTSLLILLCGVGAGVVANTTSYKLKWMKEPRAEKIYIATTQKSVVEDPGKKVIDPCLPNPDDKPHVVRKECVLHYLENGGAFIVDAREEKDFVEGHLKGAILLPSSAIYASIDRLGAAGAQVTDPIIVYCGGGDCEASHNVADALRDEFYYQQVLIYEKGWQEIESSGLFGNYLASGSEG